MRCATERRSLFQFKRACEGGTTGSPVRSLGLTLRQPRSVQQNAAGRLSRAYEPEKASKIGFVPTITGVEEPIKATATADVGGQAIAGDDRFVRSTLGPFHQPIQLGTLRHVQPGGKAIRQRDIFHADINNRDNERETPVRNSTVAKKKYRAMSSGMSEVPAGSSLSKRSKIRTD